MYDILTISIVVITAANLYIYYKNVQIEHNNDELRKELGDIL
ncbi:MAG: hypothetical protein U9Q33_06535 [Campylobacterota bacterium]|nr:hypothetical protein [Campylobacterota bacterium]